MQYRKKKGSGLIQVMSYRDYDTEKRQSVMKCVGSFSSEYSYDFKPSKTNPPTTEELQTIKEHIDEKRKANQASSLAFAVSRLPGELERFSKSIEENSDNALKNADPVAILRALELLKKTIKPHARKAAKAASAKAGKGSKTKGVKKKTAKKKKVVAKKRRK